MRQILLLALGLWALSPVAFGAPSSPKPAASPTFAAAGISVGQHVIRPGEALPVVFGVAGPPDQVRAMRSKKETDDYVMFSYYSQGFSVDINSKDNRIQGILVENRQVKLDGVPFAVGDPKAAAEKAFGQPDRTEKGVMAWWRRGVYVGVDEGGRIVNIFLAPPGKIEETPGPPERVGG